MRLHDLVGFTRFVGSLPATTMVEQWGGHVAKVGGKVFAILGTADGNLVFKVTELSFDGLTTLPGVSQAAYFAKRAWVSIEPTAPLGEDDLAAYIGASHAMIAAKLTRKLRAELGLD